MYLRETKRKNSDGSVARYLRLSNAYHWGIPDP
jgi:hypothetical protein